MRKNSTQLLSPLSRGEGKQLAVLCTYPLRGQLAVLLCTSPREAGRGRRPKAGG